MNSFLISWTLTDRQLCDCELILDNSLHPLKGFMHKDDYNSVLEKMYLQNGIFFPMPIILDVNEEFSKKIRLKEKILLVQKEGFPVATMLIESIWQPDFE